VAKPNQKNIRLMKKNMEAANINADIVACTQCLPKGRPVRYVFPEAQADVLRKCAWCSRRITKNTIGENKIFKKIGRIESGVRRYFNSKKKLVDFDSLSDKEKADIGLTPSGQQKQSSRKYY